MGYNSACWFLELVFEFHTFAVCFPRFCFFSRTKMSTLQRDINDININFLISIRAAKRECIRNLNCQILTTFRFQIVHSLLDPNNPWKNEGFLNPQLIWVITYNPQKMKVLGFPWFLLSLLGSDIRPSRTQWSSWNFQARLAALERRMEGWDAWNFDARQPCRWGPTSSPTKLWWIYP